MKKYRMLKVGEKLTKGDEYLDHMFSSKWKKTSFPGTCANVKNMYRREIKRKVKK